MKWGKLLRHILIEYVCSGWVWLGVVTGWLLVQVAFGCAATGIDLTDPLGVVSVDHGGA